MHPRVLLPVAVCAAAAVAAIVTVGLNYGAPSSPRAARGDPITPGPYAPAPAAAGVAVGSDLGGIIGRALAHRPTDHEPLAQAEAQADRLPVDARLDPADDTISFTGKRAALTIVADPPTGRDMAFRAAGLENPTIEVRRGAVVTIRFVNGDSDSAHGWILLDPVVEVHGRPHGPRAFQGAYAPMLGDPTPAGQPLETISFRAGRVGNYVYECPVPGHAALGMHGRFVVRA